MNHLSQFPDIDRIKEIIRAAGTFARHEFLNFSKQDIEYKGKNDLFSYVDVETEKKLKSAFRDLLPGAGFINEEGEDEAGENDFRWIIDPIDGTTNFTHGVPLFAISVALQYQEETVIGIVYEVVHDEMFVAQKGQGAYLNGKAISVSDTDKLSQSLIATGFPYTKFGWINEYLEMLKHFMRESHGLRRMGSAAIDLAYVAAGRFEGFFEVGLNPWDVAAGGLIVQEAGGKVTDYAGEGDFIFGKQLLASNANIHDEMLNLVGLVPIEAY